jgi:peptide/nickel transport system ATP-binding protein
MTPVLSLEAVSIAYPGQRQAWAVENISLYLAAGDRLGLVGESGCGKSTLGKAILGLLPQNSQVTGYIEVAGQSLARLSEREWRRYRGETVGLIFQDPMTRLNPLLTIGEHCLETLQAHPPRRSRLQAQQRALEVLEAVRIPASRWNQYPHEFSGGMRQRVAIALALLLNPKLIIADEPTTSLDVTVAAEILQELTRLCQERQMGLLLISHDLALVSEYCGQLAVMDQGRCVEQGSTHQIFQNPQDAYTRQLLESALHRQTSVPVPLVSPTLMRVTGLRQHFRLEPSWVERIRGQAPTQIKAVDDISFDLAQGETLGLVGESGCGKSTLLRSILQLMRPSAGQVEFLGQDLTALSPRALQPVRRQMQMIFQDPNACLNPKMTVGESIADALLIHSLATPRQAKQQVLEMLDRVGLQPAEDYARRYPKHLSGGQQQRVAIARALITRPRLVVCDEPVSMLDATVQAQVLALLSDLKRDFGLTYLFVTHDLAVARAFCDRIAVLQNGKVVELGTSKQLFRQPQHPYTRQLLGAAPALVALQDLEAG